MNPVTHFKSISEINNFVQIKTKHPLVAVVDFNALSVHIEEGVRISCDFYAVTFKNHCANKMRYGRQSYDFQDGSLVCFSPKQVIAFDSEIEAKEGMMGWGLYFHPDLIRGTSLGQKIRDYSFFSYEITEALHVSDKEKQVLYDCVLKIENELNENIDNYSQTLIVSNIELLLNYCSRYYGRQFITRKIANSTTVTQVEKLLVAYFSSNKLKESGLPTVKYLAENVHLSPNYLSDLLKKETGINAQDFIHKYIIDEAKNILLNTDKSVGEIAYSLGFEYPQYFSKLFKQKTGLTPIEFRSVN